MPQESPFWLCHECGAQMRPLMVDNVPHCASCNSEFLEILDEEVNPDPYHELPHPGGRPSEHRDYEHPLPRPAERPVETQPGFFGLLRELMGNITVGDAGQERRDTPTPNDQYEYRPYTYPNTRPPPPPWAQHQNAPQQPTPGHDHQQPRNPRAPRTFQFHIGGGSAIIEIGGGPPPNPWVGGYDGAPGDPTQGLDSYFRGFGAGAQPRAPANIEGMDLLQALMALVVEEGNARTFLPQGANLGDYVMTEDGFNDVLERLMQAAGPQGPLPAPDDVIESLPRFTFDEVSLKESQFDDCAVCKEDFAVGDRAMRLPCEHVYHEDCLVPWLKTNGSCPVCRKSLVPETPRPQASRQNSQAGPSTSSAETQGQAGGRTEQGQEAPQSQGAAGLLAGAAQTMITGVLNRLFGQQGGAPTVSNTATPAHSPPHSPPANAQEPEAVQNADRDASLRRAAEASGEHDNANANNNLDAGPPEWYRNFFAPSPDPPRSPDASSPSQAAGPSRQFPSSGQEIRRTPSFRSRTPTRTPSQRTSSTSRPSTPGGTYLYPDPSSSSGAAPSSARPNPLFARPFFQLQPEPPAPGASTAEGVSAGDGAPSTEPAPAPSAADSAPSPTVERSSSPPPQLEQAARDEQASWAKDRPERRPEDDPPEPLLEELNEYRARQAERERQQRQREEPHVDDLD